MTLDRASGDICAVYADMGTTNTRAWLMRGDEVLARANLPVGVRDTARSGSAAQVRGALRELIANVRAQASCTPAYVAAAGMIGSPLGLLELLHVSPPAGVAELASSSSWVHCLEITDLRILLVPGVRSGPAGVGLDVIQTGDVMRGEETLCVGMHTLGLIQPPAVVLNLGSHWKAIHVNGKGQVESSVTSLSGELIHAAQTQTILASSVPQERASSIDAEWMEAGMKEQRKSGASRALFCVRLLELANEGTPEKRLSFLIGIFIAADLDALISRRMIGTNDRVAVVGDPALAHAWRRALAQVATPAIVLTPIQAEKGLLAGLRCILAHSCRTRESVVESA